MKNKSNISPKKSHSQKIQSKSLRRVTTSATRDTTGEIRLNKFLAEAGVASRRKADELIVTGQVKINNNVVHELGVKVNPSNDIITVRNKPVFIEPKLVYILLNKPKDCITTASDEKGRTTVLDLVTTHYRIFPVGRLDRNTTGALLLTNDGELAYKLTHPKFGVLKTYHVQLGQSFKNIHLKKITSGMLIGDDYTAPCEAVILDPPSKKNLLVRLHEGKNRQIRRMFEDIGYDIEKLERTDYAGITTQGLKRGEWRYLHENEVKHLKKITL